MRSLKSRLVCGLLVALLCLGACAFAQDTGAAGATDEGTVQDPSFFPHSPSARYWLSGQMNFINQYHPDFPALYSGTNSLSPAAEDATSRVLTLYTGIELNNSTEFLLDIEEAGGTALSTGLGLAGNTDLDIVRNPLLSKAPYLGRVMVHKVIALSDDTEEAQRTWLSLFTQLPARRLEFRIGKFSNVDFFDINDVGSDTHFQLMNWTVDNNGAYDYAADTRGYTWGALVEYHDHGWGARFSETLMPTIANGIVLDWNLRRARGENVELEFHPGIFKCKCTAIRLMSYLNHANMGSYRMAIDQYLAGETTTPDITAHPRWTRAKYGFGMNLEQELGSGVRAFGRFGWDDDHNESFAYTEVGQSVSGGADFAGYHWKRRHDKLGIAGVVNAISGDHRRYLALGGLGFLLGDGRLNYGRERIIESYYTADIYRGLSLAPDVQYIVNPGYNRDRGPVLVPSLRLHLEF